MSSTWLYTLGKVLRQIQYMYLLKYGCISKSSVYVVCNKFYARLQYMRSK